MKKLFSIFMVMMTICFSACLVSCSGDDDEIGGGSDKPTSTKINVYTAFVNDNVFNLCDLSVTLHSGDKTKEVKLVKENGEVKTVEYDGSKLNVYCFTFDGVDGNKGIDAVEGNATLKADAESFVNSLSPEGTHAFIASHGYGEAEFSSDGHYSIGAVSLTGAISPSRKNLLADRTEDQKFYETLPRLFSGNLTKRSAK